MSSSQNSTIALTGDQVTVLQSLFSSGSYPAGYRYVQSIVQQQIDQNPGSDNTNLKILANWLSNAASINADDGSWKSEFVRGETEAFSAELGKPLSDAGFQNASDNLAQTVLKSIIDGAAIPDASTIIAEDVASAVQDLQLPPFAWAGTMFGGLPISDGGLGQTFQTITGENPYTFVTPTDPEVYAETQLANAGMSAIANIFGAVRATGVVVGQELSNALISVSSEISAAYYQNNTALTGGIFASPHGSASQISSSDFAALFNAVGQEISSIGQSLLTLSSSVATGLMYQTIGSLIQQGGALGSLATVESAIAGVLKDLSAMISSGKKGTDAADPTGGASAIASAVSAIGSSEQQIDPVVLDLVGTGINLTALSSQSPYFDLTADGYARKTAWLGSGAGFLALDPSGANITNGTQLIESFANLAKYDVDGNGIIDASDAIFSQLRVWGDANGDGVTDPGELYTLSQLGITSINLGAATASTSIAGNSINAISSYTLQDGSTREIAAVSLNNSATYTKPDVTVSVSDTIAALPQLRGAGLMSDLHSSMMGNAALTTLVDNFVSASPEIGSSGVESDVQKILYEWAGITSVSPTSRGIYVNAQHLGFLEKYLGTSFKSLSTSDGENLTNPNFKAGAAVEEAWNSVFDSLTASLVLQAPLLQSLIPEFTYDATTGLIEPATNLVQTLQGIENRLGAVTASSFNLYALSLRVMDAYRLQTGFSQSTYEKIVSAATNQTFASIASAIAFGQTVTIGSDGAITETGTPLADTFYAGSNYTKFVGRGGGTNSYQPAASNDVFNYALGNGTVEISELDPLGVTLNNQLVFGAGILPSDITTSIDSAGNIALIIAEGGEVILDSIASNPQNGVQSVIFQNGTVWNRSTILQNAAYYINGTTGADTLSGKSGHPNVFDGKGGSDVETSSNGNDTFVFNAGYGTLTINENDPYQTNSVLQLGTGITPGSVTVSLGADRTSLVLTDGVPGDKVILTGMATNSADGVGTVHFADGTVWQRSQLITDAHHFIGTSGDDTLVGWAGIPNTFDGKGGDDVETSSNGNDTFVFNAGYGTLTINENDPYQTNSVLQLGTGITPGSVTVSLGADRTSLVLTDGVPGDKVILTGMATNSADGVGTVHFADGTVWQRSQLITDAHHFIGTSGDDTLVGWAGIPNTFDGKGGDDVETSSNGNDTFVFNAGYGTLTINENDSYQTKSVLQLGAGINAASVTVGRSADGSSIVLTDGISGDQVTLTGMATNTADGVGTVQFSNGTVWTRSQVLQMAQTGANGTAVIYGTSGADTFNAAGASSLAVGEGGDDTYAISSQGVGSLTIMNGTPATNAVAGELAIGGINPSNIWLMQAGDDLQVDVMGAKTGATIKGWFSNTYNQLSEITLNGGTSGSQTLLNAQVNQLIQAMATFASSNPGFDPTAVANPTITDSNLLVAVNTAWHQ